MVATKGGIVVKAVDREVDHNQQNCSTVESMYGHGGGNYANQRSD